MLGLACVYQHVFMCSTVPEMGCLEEGRGPSYLKGNREVKRKKAFPSLIFQIFGEQITKCFKNYRESGSRKLLQFLLLQLPGSKLMARWVLQCELRESSKFLENAKARNLVRSS